VASQSRTKQTDDENTEQAPVQRTLAAPRPHKARHFILCDPRTDVFLVIEWGPNQCRRFFDFKKNFVMSLVIKSQRDLVCLDSNVQREST